MHDKLSNCLQLTLDGCMKHTAPALPINFDLKSSCHNEDEDDDDLFESSESRSFSNDSDSSTESTDSESDSELSCSQWQHITFLKET